MRIPSEIIQLSEAIIKGMPEGVEYVSASDDLRTEDALTPVRCHINIKTGPDGHVKIVGFNWELVLTENRVPNLNWENVTTMLQRAKEYVHHLSHEKYQTFKTITNEYEKTIQEQEEKTLKMDRFQQISRLEGE